MRYRPLDAELNVLCVLRVLAACQVHVGLRLQMANKCMSRTEPWTKGTDSTAATSRAMNAGRRRSLKQTEDSIDSTTAVYL